MEPGLAVPLPEPWERLVEDALCWASVYAREDWGFEKSEAAEIALRRAIIELIATHNQNS